MIQGIYYLAFSWITFLKTKSNFYLNFPRSNLVSVSRFPNLGESCRYLHLFFFNSLAFFQTPLNWLPFCFTNRYQIVSGNNDKRFRINLSSGEIFIHAPLDRETTSTYQLTIKASDRPTYTANQRSSVTFVNVTLTDVNDNKPVFKSGSYYAAVKETVNVGGDVITVQATDADAG